MYAIPVRNTGTPRVNIAYTYDTQVRGTCKHSLSNLYDICRERQNLRNTTAPDAVQCVHHYSKR